MSDKFWSEDPLILFDTTRLTEFWVSKDMTDIEKLNALMRLSIYTSILLSVYNKNPKYLVIILVTSVITFLINRYGLVSSNCPENFENENGVEITTKERLKFRTPTINNPYMNSTVYDRQDPAKHKRAIPYQNNSEKSLVVKEEIKEKFRYGIPEDYNDIYGLDGNQREFYTMPGEFTAYDKHDESRIFFFGKNDPKVSTKHTFTDGINVDYGRS